MVASSYKPSTCIRSKTQYIVEVVVLPGSSQGAHKQPLFPYGPHKEKPESHEMSVGL